MLPAATAALAQEPGGDEAFFNRLAQERQRIEQERQALLAGFDAEEQACRQRFFVNSCLGDLAVRKRQALAPLREQDIRIGEAERQRRHDQALQRRAQKQEQAEPPVSAPAQAAGERPEGERADREPARLEREAQARQRAQQQADRERAAAQRQREREAAARARARDGEGARPLPTPPAAR